MRFHTHQYIGRFDADNQIVIAHLFNHMYFIHGTLNQAFSCNATVFLYQILLQRTAVYPDTDWDAMFFCLIYHCLHAGCIPDISRIDTDLICAILNRSNRQPVIKMNVRHQWNMNLLLDFSKCFRRFYRRHSAANNLTPCFLQRMDLCNRCIYIFCLRIRHRLNCNRISSTDLHISNLYYFRTFSCHNFSP